MRCDAASLVVLAGQAYVVWFWKFCGSVFSKLNAMLNTVIIDSGKSLLVLIVISQTENIWVEILGVKSGLFSTNVLTPSLISLVYCGFCFVFLCGFGHSLWC